jgi:transcriptional/translational regulatory protein YebC/TACO1
MVSGSLDFLFERKGIFKIKQNGLSIEDFELEMIDYGLEEVEDDGEGHLMLSVPFTEFGAMQHALEEGKLRLVNAELMLIPTTFVEVSEEHEDEVNVLLDFDR